MPADAPRPRIASLPPPGGPRLITPLAEARPQPGPQVVKRGNATRPRQRAPWDDRTTAVARMPEPPAPRPKRPLPSPDDSRPLAFELEPVGWDEDDEEEVTHATDPLRKDDSGPRPKLDAAQIERLLATCDDGPPTRPDPPKHAPRAAISNRPPPAAAPRPAAVRSVALGALPVRAQASAVTAHGYANPLDRFAPRVQQAERAPMRLEPPPVVSPVRSAETAIIGTPVPHETGRHAAQPAATSKPASSRNAAASGPHPTASSSGPHATAASSGPHATASSSGPHAAAQSAPTTPDSPAAWPDPPSPPPTQAHLDPSIPPPTVDWEDLGSRVRDEVRAAVTNLGSPPRYASSASSSTLVIVAIVTSLIGGVIGSGATLLLTGGASPASAVAGDRAAPQATPASRETVANAESDSLAPEASPAVAAPSVAAAPTEPSAPSATARPATAAAAPPAATTVAPAVEPSATVSTTHAPGRLTPRQLAMRRRMGELRRQRAALARASARAQAVSSTSAPAADAPSPFVPPPAPAAPVTP